MKPTQTFLTLARCKRNRGCIRTNIWKISAKLGSTGFAFVHLQYWVCMCAFTVLGLHLCNCAFAMLGLQYRGDAQHQLHIVKSCCNATAQDDNNKHLSCFCLKHVKKTLCVGFLKYRNITILTSLLPISPIPDPTRPSQPGWVRPITGSAVKRGGEQYPPLV